MKRGGLVSTLSLVTLMLATGVFTSCSGEWPHLRVVRGNYNVSRGEYQRAIVDYLRAEDDGRFEPWIAYNLGNVYHYLGEANAALDRWSVADATNVADLRFGASFNRGVHFFEQGRYADALLEFRAALTIDPTSIDAKRNFELSLERLEAKAGISGEREGAPDGQASDGSGSSSTATRMLDYIRRKEEQQWRANAERDPGVGVQDW